MTENAFTVIYEVWDLDTMDDRDYIAARYRSETDAQADVDARNAASRLRFERAAEDGVRRAEREPWCWRQARLVTAELK